MRHVLWLAVLAAVTLTACEGSDSGEIRQWMEQQKASTKPRIQPIPEPKAFKPEAYAEESQIDPFSKEKLTQALKHETQQQGAASAALLGPELNRRKEPLEAFPLDSMAMVGSLMKTGNPVALIKVDNLLYQVRPGNYLGQNYGKVMKVGESEVVLRELVQDAAGEWVERTATLQLQEKSK